MDRETLIAVAVILYVFSVVVGLTCLGKASEAEADRLPTLGPRVFLLTVALFTLPLPTRAIFTSAIEGDVSPQLPQFAPYLSAALLYCAVFNVVFAGTYLRQWRARAAVSRSAAPRAIGRWEWAVLAVVSGMALWMLVRLAADAGGLLQLVLLGYGVTESFVGAGHYAVGFEWLTGATVVAWAIALHARRRALVVGMGALLLVQIAAYVIMGRRSALVVLGGASVYLVHALYRRLTVRSACAVVAAGFVALNVIGLLRGDKYEDLASIAEGVATRGESFRESGDRSDLFYTLTTGHFAVPFETLPQVIRTFGETYAPGVGAYTLRSFALFVPAGIWEDRPLPLANWYMKTFYGETALNEGRQFFFLSEAYMNFGALGAFVWALLFAWGWLGVSRFVEHHSRDPLAASLVAMLIGSSLALVAADSGFVVAFLKGYALPIFAVALVRRLRTGTVRAESAS